MTVNIQLIRQHTYIDMVNEIRVCVWVSLWCLSLYDPKDCSPPGSSVHEVLQARILEWVAYLFSRGSSRPRDRTRVSRIAGGFFTIWATREAPRKCALRANKKNLETSLEEACTFRRRPDIRCLCCFPLPCSFFPPLLVEVTDSSWAISYPKGWCCERAALNMPATLEHSAVATGLEKVSFHSDPKERQCQRMLKLPHNCAHLTH